jgi:hypothetical protein
VTRVPIPISNSEKTFECHILAQPARLVARAEARLDDGSEAPILRPLVYLSGFSHEYNYRLDGSASALIYLITSALIEQNSQVRDAIDLTFLWIQAGSPTDAASIPIVPLSNNGLWRQVPAYLVVMIYADEGQFSRIAPMFK